ncbi:hypothetical protein RWH44_03585 [Microbacterium sp. KSW2-29]|uniref:Uncharacterized protein n=1 Tax=Microbacterium phycohabitans TaxID=3075993 RepID=A0ABU3SJC1_9MICO|nr:hypothetical protein [Microbacterium sp. KSW2-29]MDU0344781.1 hypothetical protein [Microbacterium sp. KSW2-29]
MLEELSSDKATGATGSARGIERRTVLKGAAWSVPVIAAAVAAPAASASVNNANALLTNNVTSLLALNVLDSATVLTAAVAITVPTTLRITNGAGALSGNATVTITVGRPGGIDVSVGRAYGFGVYRFDSTLTTSGQRTATYQSAPIVGQYGFPVTTFTTTKNVSVASGGTLDIPVEWGLAGNRTGLSINALASFPISVSVVIAGRTLAASGSILVPVGAGIL